MSRRNEQQGTSLNTQIKCCNLWRNPQENKSSSFRCWIFCKNKQRFMREFVFTKKYTLTLSECVLMFGKLENLMMPDLIFDLIS